MRMVDLGGRRQPTAAFHGASLRALLWATCVFTALLAAPAHGAARVDLNPDWLFRVDADGSGESAGWPKRAPNGTEVVTVPHTWNIGTHHNYLGIAWYFRTFDLPAQPAGAQVRLNFGATFHRARVWLNGVELGAHEGGFTAYSFDVTPHLRRTNFLAVQLDNRPGAATIPGYGARGEPQAWYDWWAYGGIVRDVWLSVSGPIQILRQQVRTEHTSNAATARDRVFLQNAAPSRTKITVRATAFGPDGAAEGSATQTLDVAAGSSDIAVPVPLGAPKLWSIDRPNLYRMVVEISDARGALIDDHSDTFGVRRIEIRDRHLLVNGERVRLTGMARHEDSPWEGLAESAGTMRHDYDDMKALHTTLTRPVHYPQNPYILDYADRHGILLIPEIPVWQFSEAQLSDPRVLATAKQQMREMIEQSGNHPSVFAWSVANESATGTPGGITYFRAMRAVIRALDPDRFVSFADDNLPKLQSAPQSAANEADFLMMNEYFGSWHGPAEALAGALDKVDRLFPGKMVIISEMGFPGIFASNPAEADRARIRIMRDQLPELARRDWIAGAILWCYQDYKSRRNLWPGQDEGYVEHGLVDENRQRKPSYQVWKDLNASASLSAEWTDATGSKPGGFKASVTPRSERDLPYHPLRDYRLAWQILDQKGKLIAGSEQQLATFAAPVTVSGALPTTAEGQSFTLVLTLLRPTGAVAAERRLDWTAGGGPRTGSTQ
jgi:beta-glucuronidase